MNPKINQSLAAIGPWAIEEQAASAYLATLEALVIPEAGWGDSEGSGGYRVENGIAVIEMTGPVTKRPTCASWLFGGCDSIGLRQMVRAADRDDAVRGILMVFDSPGGEVAGTQDLAADVAGANKPVRAYVSDLCASAAYWVASQTDQIYAGPSAIIGSIGVVMAIRDSSEAEAKKGNKVHVISTGPYKGAGSSGSPVTDAHLADFQRVTDQINAEFIGTVAKGRGITLEKAAALADGRVHVGKAALDLGLIDAIASFDEVLSAFAEDTKPETKTFTWGKPAQIVHTTQTATATTAVTEKKPMKFISQLLAGLRANPEAAASLAIKTEDLDAAEREITATTTPAVDPSIAAQLAQLAGESADLAAQNKVLLDAKLDTDATAFVSAAVLAGRLSPVQTEAYIALYKNAHAADGGKPGANLKALEDAVAVSPQHSFFKSEIPGADPTKGDSLTHQPLTAEARDIELSRSPVGRKVLAMRAANGGK